ncbi:hypothetical protein Tco_0988574 [Tanacetum coccineum]|uniref:Uncharacterized protein n=1 Tax=Tanacetum coccineum TaxID=301880 RepID=A0ABQ5ES96_9ASTR
MPNHSNHNLQNSVPENLPLYDILNEFQKGHSHMAVVVRQCYKTTLEQVVYKRSKVSVPIATSNEEGERCYFFYLTEEQL